jgi:hypothetical protein
MTTEELKQELIDNVIKHIKRDIEWGDLTAIEALLSFCPITNLIGFLPEDDCKPFNDLLK